MTDFLEPWQDHEKKVRNQTLATRVMSTVLMLARRLGSTTQSAEEAGAIQQAGHEAHVWFVPKLFTVNVRFFGASSQSGVHEAFITLVENGYNGFVGAFEIDGGVKIVDGFIVIPLVRKEERVPLPQMAAAAAA